MLRNAESVAETGIDAAALKPEECDVARAAELPVETVTIDYEGREHLPSADTLAAIAEHVDVRITAPVRADGFDPLGDDTLYDRLPDAVGHVLVAGHPAYLTDEESRRAVAPRLGEAVGRSADPWVGTESVERIALATGATQFELLSRTTERDVRNLRAAGFDGDVAVYAPTVLTDDDDAVLDAVGDYVSRRGPVARALPEGAPTDSAADGRAREVLLAASRDFALVGTVSEIREQVAALREAGATTIVGYPARGLEAFL